MFIQQIYMQPADKNKTQNINMGRNCLTDLQIRLLSYGGRL